MRRPALIGLAASLGSAAAGAGLYGLYRLDIAKIRAAVEAGGERADTSYGPVEYGLEGSGPPVLVVHGAGGGYDQGLLLGRDLFGAGFRLIAPSRFGYLKTYVPDIATPDVQADAHAALLDSLHINEAIVVGISAGAPSAIEMALRHPCRVSALILVVPRAYSPETELSRVPQESVRVLQSLEAGRDFAFWCAIRFARASVVHLLGVRPELEREASGRDRARVTEILRTLLPVSRRARGLANDSATRIKPWPLERIKAPTLVISAADDLYDTLPCARYTAEHIRGAQLMVLESGGHLMVGRTEDVKARIGKFLRQLERLAAAA